MHRQTRGSLVKDNIVNQQGVVARSGLGRLECHTAVRAVVGTQHHRVLCIGGRTVGGDRLDRHKCTGIGRIGHHTHNHIGAI